MSTTREISRSSSQWRHRVIIVAAAALAGCAPAGEVEEFGGGAIENIETFARLYGHVRYFHPSDEAAAVDWNRLAVLGVSRVASARDPKDLQRELDDLFAPIAPSVRVYLEGDDAAGGATPSEPFEGERFVSWQHYGGGFARWSFYSSTRTNRPGMLGGRELTRIIQPVPVEQLRGRQVRLRASVRAEVEPGMGDARLTLMTVRSGAEGFTDEMADRPIIDPAWRRYEITGRVDEDATGLIVGMSMWGSGQAWYDAFELSASEDGAEWADVPLQNPDMQGGPDETIPGWFPFAGAVTAADHRFAASREDAVRGETAAHLQVNQPLDLFAARPEPGEVADIALGRGLRATIPLVLPSQEGQTVPLADGERLGDLMGALAELDLSDLDLDDPALRLGTVVIAWTALRHFYPYAHEVDTGWGAVLRPTLTAAARASGSYEYLRVLQRMMAALQDGHARVDHEVLTSRHPLPVALGWVQDSLVVTASVDTTVIRAGDVVVAIDGRDTQELMAIELAHASGSPGWRRLVALNGIARGEPGSVARVRIRRSGQDTTVALTRSQPSTPATPRLPPVTSLEDGVYYVDLVRVGLDDLTPRLEEMARARGIVFDVRGYPGHDAFDLLRHLSGDGVAWARMCVPMVIYPRWDPVPGCDPLASQLAPPLEPGFQGTFVFLTDARAISFAEVVMGAVEYHQLGEIVGEPTAGANGNQNGLTLPGGIQLAWTGMIVRKLDGSAHHAIGIQPTIPVTRTVEGIREGRDEVLEAALRVLGAASSVAAEIPPVPGQRSDAAGSFEPTNAMRGRDGGHTPPVRSRLGRIAGVRALSCVVRLGLDQLGGRRDTRDRRPGDGRGDLHRYAPASPHVAVGAGAGATDAGRNAARVLDVGCGEGWLSRALADQGLAVVGIDASGSLIESARAAGGAEYRLLSYDELATSPDALGSRDFDVAVCNFALLQERIDGLLQALLGLLRAGGALIIQTMHPWTVREHEYVDGWREEQFESLPVLFPEPMPWFFRTLARGRRPYGGRALKSLRSASRNTRTFPIHSPSSSLQSRPRRLRRGTTALHEQQPTHRCST